MLKSSLTKNWLVLLLFSSCYFIAGYYIPRHETISLFSVLSVAFLLYYFVFRLYKPEYFLFWVLASVVLRLILILSFPALSDDVYRFIWDGRMLLNGLNPFEHIPVDVLGKYPGLDQELYSLLNSQQRPTIYPPISQFIFWISARIGGSSILGSIVVMRAILFIFEIGTIFLLDHLLRRYGIDRKNLLLYALNPLVILEITGNLHFEGMMIFFMLLAFALLLVNRKVMAAISWGLAVGVKLIPLVAMPLFIRRFNFRDLVIFCLVAGTVSVLVFLPLFSRGFLQGMSDAVALYFVKFEFNASIYYLLREIGFAIKGWNMIAIIGPRLALTTFLLILGYTWFEWKRPVRIFEGIIWILLIYFSLAMIVHPWYVITILAMSIFTKWRWPVVWSGLIFLSYEGYTADGYVENYWLIALEYSLLAGYIFYEAQLKKT